MMREALEKQMVAMNTEKHVLEQKVKYLTRHISLIQADAQSSIRTGESATSSPKAALQ
jgi:hypothetical protein